MGHELDARVRSLPRRDVAEHGHVVRDAALAVADHGHAQPRGEGLAGAAQGRDLSLPAARGPQRVAHDARVEIRVVAQGDDAPARIAAKDVGVGDPRDPRERRVDLHDALVRVGDDDGQRAAREHAVDEAELGRPLLDAPIEIVARALGLAERALEGALALGVDVTQLEETEVRLLARKVKRERQRARAEHREREVHEATRGRQLPHRGRPRGAGQEQGDEHPSSGEHQRADADHDDEHVVRIEGLADQPRREQDVGQHQPADDGSAAVRPHGRQPLVRQPPPGDPEDHHEKDVVCDHRTHRPRREVEVVEDDEEGEERGERSEQRTAGVADCAGEALLELGDVEPGFLWRSCCRRWT